MYACFVPAFWTCYRRSAEEIVPQTRSSTPIICQDLVVIVSPVFLLRNTTRIGYSHTAGSGRRMCSMWICSLADIITSLNFLWSGLPRCLHRPEKSAKKQAFVALVSSMCSAVHPFLLRFLPLPSALPNPSYIPHPLSNSNGRKSPRLCGDNDLHFSWNRPLFALCLM